MIPQHFVAILTGDCKNMLGWFPDKSANNCVHSHQLELFKSNTFSIYPQFIDMVGCNDTALFGVNIHSNHFIQTI